jgi:hypothetical protein
LICGLCKRIFPASLIMTENIKLPRKLSEEQKPPPPRRPSHADVIENLDRWANSPELQPPKSREDETA